VSAHSTPDTPLVSVYLRDASGHRWQTNVSANSAFEAAAAALRFFEDPFWKGPKPSPDGVLEVHPMGRAPLRIRVSRVREAIEAGRAFRRLFAPGVPADLPELVAAVFSAPLVWV
jgi:hypothetical protein